MKLTVDYEADALYLQLNDSRIVDSEEAAPGVVLDYNENDQVVGVEVLGIKRSPADREQLLKAIADIEQNPSVVVPDRNSFNEYSSPAASGY